MGKKDSHVSSSVFALVLGMCVSQVDIPFPIDFAPELSPLFDVAANAIASGSFNFEIETVEIEWQGHWILYFWEHCFVWVGLLMVYWYGVIIMNWIYHYPGFWCMHLYWPQQIRSLQFL